MSLEMVWARIIKIGNRVCAMYLMVTSLRNWEKRESNVDLKRNSDERHVEHDLKLG